MKKTGTILMTVLVAAFFAACGGAADNKPANTNANANTAKPVAAAPTKETLLEMDKKATEAWLKGDVAHFEGMLSDKFVSFMNGERGDRAAELKMIKEVKCDVKSWSLDDPQMSKINDDTYVVVYKGTYDGSCTFEGKSEKMPSPMRAASVWVRNGEKWQGVYHNETPIIDPKAPPPAPAKKDEAKKEEPKKDDKAAANSNAAPAPAKPTPSANTDALVKTHQAGWEAFKAKDAKWFDANLASSFAFVDPLGGWVGSKADAIKTWTETMKCEGITKVSVSDGFASAVSPTVEILTLKGTSDGTCDGQKNGPLLQSAVYIKEGDAWKLAFMFESPAI
jgi:hypothetical protein